MTAWTPARVIVSLRLGALVLPVMATAQDADPPAGPSSTPASHSTVTIAVVCSLLGFIAIKSGTALILVCCRACCSACNSAGRATLLTLSLLPGFMTLGSLKCVHSGAV